MTVKELSDLLQKLIADGKGNYQIRSAEFENHIPTKENFFVDDKNQTFWYEA